MVDAALVTVSVLLVLALAVVAGLSARLVVLRHPPSRKTVVVVGTGLAAASCIRALPAGARVQVREALDRVGGRALTMSPPAQGISTTTAPREFAAWIMRDAPHSATARLLTALGVQTTEIPLVTPQSFIFNGQRRAWGVLALSGTAPEVVLAHTGFPADAGVPHDLLQLQDMPATARVPTGFGWQDVALRGIGGVPVRYSHQLDSVVPGPGGVQLEYTSGQRETVPCVVLTMAPRQLLAIRTLPAWTASLIRDSFRVLSEGVMYATWSPADAGWFARAGYTQGVVVATGLPVQRMVVTGPAELRFTTSSVEFWTRASTLGRAAQEVAAQLSAVFETEVPAPANVVFKSWVNAVGFWSIADPQARARVQARLTRPWGPAVPVFWASSDLSDTPGWVEGAVQSGEFVGAAVHAVV